MIIDNSFAIKPYLGSISLPLINAPASLLSNSIYATFINNIVSIYSTQSINGNIPVFSRQNNTTNPFSSLTSLEPLQSYYFISKNNVSFPYNIPYNGNLLTYSSSSACTSIDIVPDNVVLTSASGNYYYYNQNLNNLTTGLSYAYNFKILQSNWPVNISPLSGVIQSSQASNNFGSVMRFDSDNGVTNYSTFLPAGTDIGQIDKKNLYAFIEVSVQPPNDTSCPKVLDILRLRCDNCVPAPSMTPTTTPTPTPTPPPAFNTMLTFNGSTVGSNGVNFGNTAVGDTLEFNAVSPITGTPATTIINIGGVTAAIASITSDYIGLTFRYTKFSTGLKYVGTFTNGTRSF
jgi:hypothetical protein